MEEMLADMMFGKEGEFGILPLAKSVLETYFPEEAEEWERTGELEPVRGGVVLPGIKYVWVGRKGFKTREIESRGIIAMKPAASEVPDDFSTMDPADILEFIQEKAPALAERLEVSLEEATARLRVFFGLTELVYDPADELNLEGQEPYPCQECGETIAVLVGEEVPNLCDPCLKEERSRLFFERLHSYEEEPAGLNEFEELEFAEREALEKTFVADRPAKASGKFPEKLKQSRPQRQSKWNKGRSGKRPVPSKEARLTAEERFFGARISEELYHLNLPLDGFAVFDHQVGHFLTNRTDENVVYMTGRKKLGRLQRSMKGSVEVYGAPEKVAITLDRRFFERVFLPLEGHT